MLYSAIHSAVFRRSLYTIVIVENYMGLPIAFQGIHFRRDFANKSPVTTEFWHQDLENRRILKVIIYLSDVSEEHGLFEYIPKPRVSPLLSWLSHYKIRRADSRIRV